jgi:hypothetical protein
MLFHDRCSVCRNGVNLSTDFDDEDRINGKEVRDAKDNLFGYFCYPCLNKYKTYFNIKTDHIEGMLCSTYTINQPQKFIDDIIMKENPL